jgi:hypothetical protein
MNSSVGQRLWKSQLVAALLTIVVKATVLAGPSDSIAVLTLTVGIWLVTIGIIGAFETREAASGVRQTVDEMSSRVATALIDPTDRRQP